MLQLNECIWYSSTSGNGAFTVNNAVQGYYTPEQCSSPPVSNNGQYAYRAENASKTEYESGWGFYNNVTHTLTREVVYQSSANNGLVSFTTNPIIRISSDAKTIGATDRELNSVMADHFHEGWQNNIPVFSSNYPLKINNQYVFRNFYNRPYSKLVSINSQSNNKACYLNVVDPENTLLNAFVGTEPSGSTATFTWPDYDYELFSLCFGNTFPTSGNVTVTASSENPSFPASNAKTAYTANSQPPFWIQWQFDTPGLVKQVYMATGGTWGNTASNTFATYISGDIQGSINGNNWTTICNWLNVRNSAEMFVFLEDNSYTYYRVNFTDTDSSDTTNATFNFNLQPIRLYDDGYYLGQSMLLANASTPYDPSTTNSFKNFYNDTVTLSDSLGTSNTYMMLDKTSAYSVSNTVDNNTVYWVKVDIGTVRPVYEVRWISSNTLYALYNGNQELYGSTDDSTYTLLGYGATGGGQDRVGSQNFNHVTVDDNYRYFKIQATVTYPESFYVSTFNAVQYPSLRCGGSPLFTSNSSYYTDDFLKFDETAKTFRFIATIEFLDWSQTGIYPLLDGSLALPNTSIDNLFLKIYDTTANKIANCNSIDVPFTLKPAGQLKDIYGSSNTRKSFNYLYTIDTGEIDVSSLNTDIIRYQIVNIKFPDFAISKIYIRANEYE